MKITVYDVPYKDLMLETVTTKYSNTVQSVVYLTTLIRIFDKDNRTDRIWVPSLPFGVFREFFDSIPKFYRLISVICEWEISSLVINTYLLVWRLSCRSSLVTSSCLFNTLYGLRVYLVLHSPVESVPTATLRETICVGTTSDDVRIGTLSRRWVCLRLWSHPPPDLRDSPVEWSVPWVRPSVRRGSACTDVVSW